jgi:hypothetical protein
VMVLVEAQPTQGAWLWHGMASVGGKVVNDIYGSDRAGVLDDCLCAVAEAGIEVEPGENDHAGLPTPTDPKGTENERA